MELWPGNVARENPYVLESIKIFFQPSMWSIFMGIPYTIEKNMFSLFIEIYVSRDNTYALNAVN